MKIVTPGKTNTVFQKKAPNGKRKNIYKTTNFWGFMFIFGGVDSIQEIFTLPNSASPQESFQQKIELTLLMGKS